MSARLGPMRRSPPRSPLASHPTARPLSASPPPLPPLPREGGQCDAAPARGRGLRMAGVAVLGGRALPALARYVVVTGGLDPHAAAPSAAITVIDVLRRRVVPHAEGSARVLPLPLFGHASAAVLSTRTGPLPHGAAAADRPAAAAMRVWLVGGATAQGLLVRSVISFLCELRGADRGGGDGCGAQEVLVGSFSATEIDASVLLASAVLLPAGGSSSGDDERQLLCVVGGLAAEDDGGALRPTRRAFYVDVGGGDAAGTAAATTTCGAVTLLPQAGELPPPHAAAAVASVTLGDSLMEQRTALCVALPSPSEASELAGAVPADVFIGELRLERELGLAVQVLQWRRGRPGPPRRVSSPTLPALAVPHLGAALTAIAPNMLLLLGGRTARTDAGADGGRRPALEAWRISLEDSPSEFRGGCGVQCCAAEVTVAPTCGAEDVDERGNAEPIDEAPSPLFQTVVLISQGEDGALLGVVGGSASPPLLVLHVADGVDAVSSSATVTFEWRAVRTSALGDSGDSGDADVDAESAEHSATTIPLRDLSVATLRRHVIDRVVELGLVDAASTEDVLIYYRNRGGALHPLHFDTLLRAAVEEYRDRGGSVAPIPTHVSIVTPPTVYRMLDELGAGTFGVVHSALDQTTGRMFAIKTVKVQDEAKLVAHRAEIAMMRHLRHPNIVRYLGSEVQEGSTMRIMMEFVAGGGTLEELCQKMRSHHRDALPMRQVQMYTRQLLLALDYLHSHGVSHRDLKPANVLLSTDGSCKLADFGSAKLVTGMTEPDGGLVGTCLFMAPEVVDPSSWGRPSTRSDVWSLACLVVQLATNEHPYHERHFDAVGQVLFFIGSGNAPRVPDALPPDGRDFVGRCLVAEPQRRPTVAELLQHPFMCNLVVVEQPSGSGHGPRGDRSPQLRHAASKHASEAPRAHAQTQSQQARAPPQRQSSTLMTERTSSSSGGGGSGSATLLRPRRGDEGTRSPPPPPPPQRAPAAVAATNANANASASSGRPSKLRAARAGGGGGAPVSSVASAGRGKGTQSSQAERK